MAKKPPANAGDVGSIPGSGRSPGEGNGNPLEYSCLEIPWTEGPGGPQSMVSQRIRHYNIYIYVCVYIVCVCVYAYTYIVSLLLYFSQLIYIIY